MTENGRYEETDFIQTTDEEGQLHIFEKVDELEIEGQEYALLIYKGTELGENGLPKPNEEEGYDEEVVVMKVSHEDGQEVFEAIEDEDEFERVVSFIENMEVDEDEVTIDLGDFIAELGADDEEESKN